MQANRRTQLLILLLIAAAIAAGSGWSILQTSRANAAASLRDLGICKTELVAIDVKSPAAAAGSSPTSDDKAINRQLRAAAIAAHLSDQLASIDPGTAARIRDSDYTQTPIYVRLNAVALRQLIGFLYELSITDQSLRTSDIELSPPLVNPPNRTDSSDLWTADVTLSYLEYAQRQSQPLESR